MTRAASLAAALEHHATTTPSAVCTIHLATQTVHTWAQLLATTRRLVAVLAERGVGAGHRVVVGVRNHWLHLPLLIACGARRARLVPVDPELHRDVLAALLAEDAEHTLLIQLDPGDAPSAVSLASLLRRIDEVDDAIVDGIDLAPHAGDVVLMLSTSGTTGAGKRVMLTDDNLVENASALADRYGIGVDDRFMCTLPTHHMNAIMITGLVPLLAGASVVLDDILSFKNAKHYWRNVALHGVSVISMVPSIMALLLRLFPRGVDHDVARLRLGLCGAAPLSAETWRAFEATFGVSVAQGYGLTETTCWAVSTLPGEVHDHTSVGVPLPGCAVRIDRGRVDADALVFAEAAHDHGEVVIGGPIVFAGYSGDAALTSSSLTADGALRTGDLGYFDGEGRLHISGRLKEIVIRNGVNIFAPELDRLLLQHPAIEAAKTIGVPDDLVGERLWCACVRREGDVTSEQALRAWLQERLSRAWWPDGLELVGALPRGGAGKVLTSLLRQILSGALARELVAAIVTVGDTDEARALVQRQLTRGAPVALLAFMYGAHRDVDGALEQLRAQRDMLRRTGLPTPTVTIVLGRVDAADHTWRATTTTRANALGFDVIADDDDEAAVRARHPDHVVVHAPPVSQLSPRAPR